MKAKFGIEGGVMDSTVTDTRQGAMVGFGQRWTFWSHAASVTLGASYTFNMRRSVDLDSDDPQVREDYDKLLERIPDTRMSARAMPEVNLGLGYMF